MVGCREKARSARVSFCVGVCFAVSLEAWITLMVLPLSRRASKEPDPTQNFPKELVIVEKDISHR